MWGRLFLALKLEGPRARNVGSFQELRAWLVASKEMEPISLQLKDLNPDTTTEAWKRTASSQ